MILYFVRHASAGDKFRTPGRDEQRALDDQGRRDSRLVGQMLRSLEIEPDLIISSPLRRALETATLIAEELGYKHEVETDPALRPAATFEVFLRFVDKHKSADALMVVGHNPNLSEFLSLVISANANSQAVDLKKGAVAKVEVDHGLGVLSWCFTPKIARVGYETATSSLRRKTSRK